MAFVAGQAVSREMALFSRPPQQQTAAGPCAFRLPQGQLSPQLSQELLSHCELPIRQPNLLGRLLPERLRVKAAEAQR